MLPLVLLHAFPLTSAMYADLDLPGLYAPDLAGFGGSPVPAEPPDLDVLARELAADLDRRGYDRVLLGGVSMGGYVAMAFLRRYADRVGALLLSDTKATADSPEAAANRLRTADAVLAAGDAGTLVRDLVPNLLAPDADPGIRHRVEELTWAARPAAVAWAQRAMAGRPDSTEVLRTVAVPTLVVVGEYDRLTPPPDAAAMVAALPAGELVTISGAGHLPPMERPRDFTAAVLRVAERA